MNKFTYMDEANAGDMGGAGGGAVGGSTQGTDAVSAPFFSSFKDANLKTWAEAKAFPDAESVASSAWNLEKLIGHDKAGRTIVMPGDSATPEEITAYRAKLGVPESADGYQLPIPEGQDPAFSKTAAEWFHDAGVTPKSAEQIATKWNEFQANQMQAMEAKRAEQSNSEFKEWESAQGSALAQNLELGKRAVRQFGLDAKGEDGLTVSDKIENAIGTKAYMEFIAKMGTGLGEHKMLQGGETSGMMTPVQAQDKIGALSRDREWTKAYLNGDSSKIAEMQKLHAQAYPEARD